MAAYAIRAQSNPDQQLLFHLRRIPRDGKSTTARRLTLKLILGPGDDGKPVTGTAPDSATATIFRNIAAALMASLEGSDQKPAPRITISD